MTGAMQEITGFLPPDFHQMREAERLQAIQSAKDAVEPNRANQGPVFEVGEEIEIRGGRFRITRIEPGHMRLLSLPSHKE